MRSKQKPNIVLKIGKGYWGIEILFGYIAWPCRDWVPQQSSDLGHWTHRAIFYLPLLSVSVKLKNSGISAKVIQPVREACRLLYQNGTPSEYELISRWKNIFCRKMVILPIGIFWICSQTPELWPVFCKKSVFTCWWVCIHWVCHFGITAGALRVLAG